MSRLLKDLDDEWAEEDEEENLISCPILPQPSPLKLMMNTDKDNKTMIVIEGAVLRIQGVDF